jgi:4-hydroxy-3-methylbut-2-enyl diphosphate reductase
MGVQRALNLVLAEIERGREPLFTFGPLIHNKQVVDLLRSKGVKRAKNLNDIREGKIILRAHGIPPQDRRRIREARLKILDATCPRVARIQALIRYYTGKGFSTIIVGDHNHAEVTGLVGHGNDRTWIVERSRDVLTLPDIDQPLVVAQTTQNIRRFNEIVKTLKDRFPALLIFNTICNATNRRQQEVKNFKGYVDAVVVVGGYHSGNTQRLVEVAMESDLQTFHVETEKDLDKHRLSKMKVVGVTAGASTPDWLIRVVVSELEGIR